MKRLGLWACLWAGLLGGASAQMTVDLTQTQDQFLPGEPLIVAVRVSNISGQRVDLGTEPDWLTFVVETQQGTIVPQLMDIPVVQPFSLESSEVGTKRVDLAPYFALNQAGTFKVTATVKVKAWSREIASGPRSFDILNGVKLWEQPFGVPRGTNSPAGAPEMRRYVLEQAHYLHGETRLYLRVTDPSGAKPLKVVPVGNLISLSRPEHVVDSASHLHVLFQNGPHSYSYSQFSPDGELKLRQTYDYVSTRPRLHVVDQDNIVVAGGARRVAKSDIPPPEPLVLPEGPLPVDRQ